MKNRGKYAAAKQLVQRMRNFKDIQMKPESLWIEHTYIAGYINCMFTTGFITEEKQNFLFNKLAKIENEKIKIIAYEKEI